MGVGERQAHFYDKFDKTNLTKIYEINKKKNSSSKKFLMQILFQMKIQFIKIKK